MEVSPELLHEAYARIEWNGQIGEMLLPDGDSIEIELHIPRESSQAWIMDVLSSLECLDGFVRQTAQDFELAYMEIFDNRISLDYWGITVNSQFGVQAFREAGQWYVTRMGMREFKPPVCVNSGCSNQAKLMDHE